MAFLFPRRTRVQKTGVRLRCKTPPRRSFCILTAKPGLRSIAASLLGTNQGSTHRSGRDYSPSNLVIRMLAAVTPMAWGQHALVPQMAATVVPLLIVAGALLTWATRRSPARPSPGSVRTCGRGYGLPGRPYPTPPVLTRASFSMCTQLTAKCWLGGSPAMELIRRGSLWGVLTVPSCWTEPSGLACVSRTDPAGQDKKPAVRDIVPCSRFSVSVLVARTPDPDSGSSQEAMF